MLPQKNRSGVQFKYEAYWEDHNDCKATVKKGWDQPTPQEDTWKDVMNRLKSCKKELSIWHKKCFKAADKEIGKLKEQLNRLQNAYSTLTNWEDMQAIRKEIDQLWRQEEKYWGQRSRLQWV